MQHVFISAERSTLKFEGNLMRTISMAKILEGLEISGFKVSAVEGRYKGTSELSFRVTATETSGPMDVGFFRELGRRFNQESILWVNEDNAAFLDYIESGEKVHLGTLVQVDSIEGLDAYSIVDGKIFTVK